MKFKWVVLNVNNIKIYSKIYLLPTLGGKCNVSQEKPYFKSPLRCNTVVKNFSSLSPLKILKGI